MNVILFASDSENDSDYEPEIDSKSQEQTTINAPDQQKIKTLWEDLNQASETQSIPIPKPEASIQDALEAAKRIKQQELQHKQTDQNLKINFAGETVQITKLPAKRPRGSVALDKLVSDVTKKKSINTITKSALDWEKYKDKMSLENTLSTNRKNGYIDKTKFLTESKLKEAESIKKMKRRQ